LCAFAAVELRELYKRGEVSPVEVVAAVLNRIDELNPTLNMFLTVTAELAFERARAAEATLLRAGSADGQPLLGIPVSIKDTIATNGVRTTMGSLLRERWIPDFDAPAVERLHAAGAVLLGKTNTSEFGWKGDSGNLLIGPTHNPWNQERTAGGSSGGAAAAVACGLGPLALATDGGGSIRIPAAFCGVFGHKPSFGLVPMYPPTGIGTLSHQGPIVRSVKDAALLLTVISGPDDRDPLSLDRTGMDYLSLSDGDLSDLRVGWSPDLGWTSVEPEVLDLAAKAAQTFEGLGCGLSDATPDFDEPRRILEVIVESAQAAQHRNDPPDVRAQIDPGRLSLVDAGLRLSAADLAEATVKRGQFYEQMRLFMNQFDLLLTPTVPVTPFLAGEDGPSSIAGAPTSGFSWTVFNYPFNLTGQPAASVPCGFTSDGLPVGLQIVGRWRDDATVLRAAAVFEAARPWPAVCPLSAVVDGPDGVNQEKRTLVDQPGVRA
jgi:Asp-tRNA(Asn)/Glu-tRNA(Gln) amidotransferase A subunit family amidase